MPKHFVILEHVDPATSRISSTLVRERLSRWESIDDLVVPKVADYIRQRELYT